MGRPVSEPTSDRCGARYSSKSSKDVVRRGGPPRRQRGVSNMNATATLAPAGPQYMRALERANKVRLARAELKRRIATGELEVAEVILECPWEAAEHGGRGPADEPTPLGREPLPQVARAAADVRRPRRVGSMTDRQRRTLAAACREQSPPRARWRSAVERLCAGERLGSTGPRLGTGATRRSVAHRAARPSARVGPRWRCCEPGCAAFKRDRAVSTASRGCYAAFKRGCDERTMRPRRAAFSTRATPLPRIRRGRAQRAHGPG